MCANCAPIYYRLGTLRTRVEGPCGANNIVFLLKVIKIISEVGTNQVLGGREGGLWEGEVLEGGRGVIVRIKEV